MKKFYSIIISKKSIKSFLAACAFLVFIVAINTWFFSNLTSAVEVSKNVSGPIQKNAAGIAALINSIVELVKNFKW